MSLPAFPTSLQATHREGFLNSGDHTRLYWRCFTPPEVRGTVAVLHGGGDHSGRYPALCARLVAAGFRVALLDLRGHGQSDGRRWHVDAFQDYLADLDALVARMASEPAPGRRFVVGQGLGALIALRWGLDHPGGFDGYVLVSPLLGPPTGAARLGESAATLLSRLSPRRSVASGLLPEELTSDQELRQWTAQDPLRGTTTTPRWLASTAAARREVRARAGQLSDPLLLLAGGSDGLCDPDDAVRFFAEAGPVDKQLLRYDGFRHELFNERGRERPLSDTVDWILAHAG
jgi:alpha-beta hydrolase superfamily lysophospholipase